MGNAKETKKQQDEKPKAPVSQRQIRQSPEYQARLKAEREKEEERQREAARAAEKAKG